MDQDKSSTPKCSTGILNLFGKRNALGTPSCKDSAHRMKCKRRHSVFKLLSFPTVCAESLPSATDKIEQAENAQKGISSSFISETEVQEYLLRETGMDRLRLMFAKDHIGQMSPELQIVCQVPVQAAAITFFITSFFGGRHAREDFVRQNQATIFPTRFKAFRSLQDTIFLQSMRDGTRWAFRIAIFSFSLLGVSQSIAVYRNKSSPFEYAAGFGVTGALMKFNLGLKGMFAGGVFGAAMGLVAGCLLYGAMYGLNETQEHRHYLQIQKILEIQKAARGQLVSPETGEQLQPQPVV